MGMQARELHRVPGVKHDGEPRNPRIVLEDDHAAIDAMLRELADQVRAEDRTIAPGTWDRVEVALLAHMNVEEMFIVPLLAGDDPKAADTILRTHAEIRSQIGEIGLAFDLRTVRADAIDQFCNSLRAHIAHESELLYPLAERRLPVSTVRSVLARLRGRGAPPKRKAAAAQPH